MTILENSHIERAEGLAAAQVGDGMVIMSLESGYFYQLNRVAARVWMLLDKPAELSNLCERMQAMFEIEREACQRDITDFVLAMENLRMLRIE